MNSNITDQSIFNQSVLNNTILNQSAINQVGHISEKEIKKNESIIDRNSNVPSQTQTQTQSQSSNDIISPSIQMLTRTFEEFLYQYKQQLSFSNFLQHFPDDFSLQNFDLLQKLYQTWLINLEANLRKEFEKIIETFNLKEQLFNLDKMSFLQKIQSKNNMYDNSNGNSVAQLGLNQDARNIDDIINKQNVALMNSNLQKEILNEYNTLNRRVQDQIEEKKIELQQFILRLNESIVTLQQLIDPSTSTTK